MTFSAIMDDSSWPNLTSLTPQAVRESWIPRVLMLRRLLEMLTIRLRFCVALKARADQAPSGKPQYHLDLLYQTWLLAENTFSVLEALAAPDRYDIRTAASRRQLLDAIGGRSVSKGLGSFIRKAWGLWFWKHVFTEDVYRARGFTPEAGTAVLRTIVARSLESLKEGYETLGTFRMKYADLCRAHKHGRAAFGFQVTGSSPDAMAGASIKLTMAPGNLVVLRSSALADGSDSEFIRLTIDDEFRTDVDGALRVLASQVPLLKRRMAHAHGWCAAYLAVLEGELPADHPVDGRFDLFVPPYSADERRLLGLEPEGAPSGAAEQG